MATELITLIPKQMPTGVVDWVICHRNNCGGPGHPTAKDYPVIKVGMNKSPLMIFQIKNELGGPEGITFASANNPQDPLDASSAFWVTPGQGKHPTGGQNSNAQFNNIVLASPTALVFNNKNNGQSHEYYSYALNFSAPAEMTVKSIDPDILNGGKGFYSETAMLLIGGAVVAALVAAFVAYFVARFAVARALSKPGTKHTREGTGG